MALVHLDLDLDELRCYIQLSGLIVVEQSLRMPSTQLLGFSNQGFKTFHTIHWFQSTVVLGEKEFFRS